MGLGLNTSLVTALGVLGLLVGLTVSEVGEPEKEALFHPWPISMSLAVQTAEAVAPGQAMHAQLAIAQGRPVYAIDLLGLDHRVTTVQVDAEDGEVALVVREAEDPREEIHTIQPPKGGTIWSAHRGATSMAAWFARGGAP